MRIIRVNGQLSELFKIKKSVKQGCVMSPWLFNLYIDLCVCDLKDDGRGVRMNEINVCGVLYVDDMVMVTGNEGDLRDMISELYERCL